MENAEIIFKITKKPYRRHNQSRKHSLNGLVRDALLLLSSIHNYIARMRIMYAYGCQDYKRKDGA